MVRLEQCDVPYCRTSYPISRSQFTPPDDTKRPDDGRVVSGDANWLFVCTACNRKQLASTPITDRLIHQMEPHVLSYGSHACLPNGMSIGSAVFASFTRMADTQTDT